MSDPVQFVQQKVDLDYKVVTAPVHRRFDEQMRAGRIIGHKCPECGLVFVPPKGFCPLSSVVTTEADEVEIKDVGTLTSFTVVTPIQYEGQQEKDEYVLASILLDGADSTVGQQRIEGLPHNEVRMGLRVKAVWAKDRDGDEGVRGWGLGAAIEHWVPTGEPDVPKEEYQEHVL